MRADRISIIQAQADIIRFCGNVQIVDESSIIYDFTVHDVRQGLSFGVYVVSSKYETTSMFKEFQDNIQTTNLYDSIFRMPIILMAVNTNSQSTSFGIVVSWHREQPTINKKISMRESNEKSWGIALDHILSMNDAICVLSNYGINIKKTIRIESERIDGLPCNGEIVYLRNFSDSYKMNQKIITNEKERFERLVYGIPEDEYPSDILDEIIIEAVKQQWNIIPYGEHNCKSESMLFTTDLKELQVYKNYYPLVITVEVTPNWNDIPQYILPMLNGLELVSIPITVYCHSKEAVDYLRKDQILCHKISIDEWKEMSEEIRRLNKTVHQLNEYFE